MTTDDIHFEKKDWGELLYDPSIVPQGKDILSYYSALSKFAEFQVPIQINVAENPRLHKDMKLVDKNTVIKYVMVLYDRNSKYNVCKDPLNMRKNAAIIAGWKPDKEGYFPKEVEIIMRGESAIVNCMAIRYARIYYNMEYTSLVSDLIAWYKLTYDINSDIVVKDGNDDAKQRALKLMQDRKKFLENNISALMKKILSDDNNPYLKADLFRMVDDDADDIVLSPERMATVNSKVKEVK